MLSRSENKQLTYFTISISPIDWCDRINHRSDAVAYARFYFKGLQTWISRWAEGVNTDTSSSTKSWVNSKWLKGGGGKEGIKSHNIPPHAYAPGLTVCSMMIFSHKYLDSDRRNFKNFVFMAVNWYTWTLLY